MGDAINLPTSAVEQLKASARREHQKAGVHRHRSRMVLGVRAASRPAVRSAPAAVPLTELPTIGLCLSGGGFRASLYALGVLRYLAEANVLARTTVATGVSGGSVTAAALAAGVADDPAALGHDQFLRRTFEPFVATVTTTNLRNRALVRWARERISGGDRARNLVLSEVLGKALYPRVGALADMPRRPQLIVTGTDLDAGRAFRFSQEFIGSFNWDYVDTPAGMTLATAVAASVAAPPAFPPLQLQTAGLGFRRRPPAVLSITDGGVYDNLGIEWFQGWGTAPRPPQAAEADFLVVVNASGPLLPSVREFNGVWALNRCRKVQYAQTQATRVRWLVADLEAGRRRGAYLGITADPRRYRLPDGEPIDPSLYDGALPSRLVAPLARLRTDLDRFTVEEASLLSYHGYWSTHARLASLYPDMSVGSPSWREYADLDRGHAARLEHELSRARHRMGIGEQLR
jgi:NTE family protein